MKKKELTPKEELIAAIEVKIAETGNGNFQTLANVLGAFLQPFAGCNIVLLPNTMLSAMQALLAHITAHEHYPIESPIDIDRMTLAAHVLHLQRLDYNLEASTLCFHIANLYAAKKDFFETPDSRAALYGYYGFTYYGGNPKMQHGQNA